MKKRTHHKNLLENTLIALSLVILLLTAIHVTQYPEIYSTTAKYHLHNDLLKGDHQAIKYYYDTYVSTGKELFNDIDLSQYAFQAE